MTRKPTFAGKFWLSYIAILLVGLGWVGGAFAADFKSVEEQAEAAVTALEQRVEALEKAEPDIDLSGIKADIDALQEASTTQADRIDALSSQLDTIQATLEQMQSGGSGSGDTGGTDGGTDQQSWLIDNGDTWTVATISLGDWTYPKGQVFRVGNCTDCTTLDEATAQLEDREQPATFHFYGGTYNKGLPYKRLSDLTVIGHAVDGQKPTFTTNITTASNTTVIANVVQLNSEMRGSRGEKLLYIRDSKFTGNRQGTINSGEGHGALEIWNSDVCCGGGGNVDHVVYEHSDFFVAVNSKFHTGVGGHTLKLMGDKFALIDSEVANVPLDYARRVADLSHVHHQWFKFACSNYGTVGYHDCSTKDGRTQALDWYMKTDWRAEHKPHWHENGPTGVWQGRTMDEWASLWTEWRNQRSHGTTTLDMMACSDSYISGTTIYFDRRDRAGENATQLRARRTEHGGCADPRWYEEPFSITNPQRNPDFYDEATWADIGAVNDPANALLKRHIFKNSQIIAVGPRSNKANLMRNHGTAPVDADYSGGTTESYPTPDNWVERSQVFFDTPASEIATGKMLELGVHRDCVGECSTTEAERTPGIHYGADLSDVTLKGVLRAPQLSVVKGLCEPDAYGFCANETPFPKAE